MSFQYEFSIFGAIIDPTTYLNTCNCNVKRTKINKKRTGLTHYFKKSIYQQIQLGWNYFIDSLQKSFQSLRIFV